MMQRNVRATKMQKWSGQDAVEKRYDDINKQAGNGPSRRHI